MGNERSDSTLKVPEQERTRYGGDQTRSGEAEVAATCPGDVAAFEYRLAIGQRSRERPGAVKVYRWRRPGEEKGEPDSGAHRGHRGTDCILELDMQRWDRTRLGIPSGGGEVTAAARPPSPGMLQPMSLEDCQGDWAWVV